MRRGFALLAVAVALAALAPFAQAQYPYAPSPYGPAAGYGYPPAMYQQPAYGPAYPVQYYPAVQQAPMYYPPNTAPRVYNFGPLAQDNAAPMMTTVPDTPVVPTATRTSSAATVSPTSAPAPRTTLVHLFRPHAAPKEQGCGPQGCGPEGCGPQGGGPEGCGPQGCGPQGCPPAGCGDACAPCDVCLPPLRQPRPYPRGHCFGDVGAFFFVAAPSNRSAFKMNGGDGSTSTTNFPFGTAFAPRFALGYVFHTGWGFRADYWYTHINTSAAASNSTLGVTAALTTPTATPFVINSPSATLIATAGASPDQFTATQAIQVDIAAAEVVRECSLFDMTYLFGFGARYGTIRQSYSATRTNYGIGFDREDVNTQTRYEGLGPTISLDGVCPICWNCLSLYGNLRASALFGTQTFDQSYALQSTTLGVVNTTNSSHTTDNRSVYGLEFETGLQVGKRVGPCYVFSRTGVAVQRWFDVGSPTSTTGSLSFLGGTFQVGLTY